MLNDEVKGSPLKEIGKRLSLRRKKVEKEVLAPKDDILYLSLKEASQVKNDLETEYKLSPFQLAEHLGYSSACSIMKCYQEQSGDGVPNSALLVAGPGFNGAVGLSLGRYLVAMGWQITVYYPRPNKQFKMFFEQIESCQITNLSYLPDASLIKHNYQFIIDAINTPTELDLSTESEPFVLEIGEKLKDCGNIIISLDVPIGWDPNYGKNEGALIPEPEMLISLIVPKKCAKLFKGKYHALCGRQIIPMPMIAKCFNAKCYDRTEGFNESFVMMEI